MFVLSTELIGRDAKSAYCLNLIDSLWYDFIEELCNKMRTNNSVSHWLRHKKTKSAIEELDNDEFEAEQIIDKRVSPCGRRIHYLVKWKEYPVSVYFFVISILCMSIYLKKNISSFIFVFIFIYGDIWHI